MDQQLPAPPPLSSASTMAHTTFHLSKLAHCRALRLQPDGCIASAGNSKLPYRPDPPLLARLSRQLTLDVQETLLGFSLAQLFQAILANAITSRDRVVDLEPPENSLQEPCSHGYWSIQIQSTTPTAEGEVQCSQVCYQEFLEEEGFWMSQKHLRGENIPLVNYGSCGGMWDMENTTQPLLETQIEPNAFSFLLSSAEDDARSVNGITTLPLGSSLLPNIAIRGRCRRGRLQQRAGWCPPWWCQLGQGLAEQQDMWTLEVEVTRLQGKFLASDPS